VLNGPNAAAIGVVPESSSRRGMKFLGTFFGTSLALVTLVALGNRLFLRAQRDRQEADRNGREPD
jgi:hypothetical protein